MNQCLLKRQIKETSREKKEKKEPTLINFQLLLCLKNERVKGNRNPQFESIFPLKNTEQTSQNGLK